MNNFIFENATKVYFGQGCVQEYLTCLVQDASTVLLAYGGGSIRRNGIYDQVAGLLRQAGKTVVDFPGIPSNPTYDQVLAGAKTGPGDGGGLDPGGGRRLGDGLRQGHRPGRPVPPGRVGGLLGPAGSSTLNPSPGSHRHRGGHRQRVQRRCGDHPPGGRRSKPAGTTPSSTPASP